MRPWCRYDGKGWMRSGGMLFLCILLALVVAACAPQEPNGGEAEPVEPVVQPNFVAPYLAESPAVEGGLEDWPIPYLRAMASTSDIYRNSDRWEGRQDHALWLWAGWDDNHLYLAFQRADDHLRYDVAEDIEDAEDQDAIVIYLSVEGSDEKTVFHLTTIDGEPVASHEDILYAVKESGSLGPEEDLSGEIHEIAIPHDLLPVSPEEGVHMLMLPVSIDVDEDGRTESVVSWRATNPETRSEYGILEFGGPPENDS